MDAGLFKSRILKFLATIPIISVVNNMLKWSIGELKIRLRANLTHRIYEDYMKTFTYYRMSNLDNRIANADQLLTTDVDKFCDSVTNLYSNISKPILDISIYVYRLTTNLGGETPSILLGYLFFSGVFLTYLRRPTGKYSYKATHLDLKTCCFSNF